MDIVLVIESKARTIIEKYQSSFSSSSLDAQLKRCHVFYSTCCE
jgi:hypothetical protein